MSWSCNENVLNGMTKTKIKKWAITCYYKTYIQIHCFDLNQFLWNRDKKKQTAWNYYDTKHISCMFPQFHVMICELLKRWRKRILFFGHVDYQPVGFSAVIHLMSEKRDWGTAFSNSLLMAIYV